MSAPIPVSCEVSDHLRDAMTSRGARRVVPPEVFASDFSDGDVWVLTDYLSEAEEGACWHVANSAYVREDAS